MLSDEDMVQRQNMQHTASDSTPLSVYFLIANARLEFSVNYRKNSPLKVSNRERIAIFHPRSHIKLQGCRARGATMPLACPEEDHRRRRAPEFLIATVATSENQSSSSKQRTKQNSNSNKNGISGDYGAPILACNEQRPWEEKLKEPAGCQRYEEDHESRVTSYKSRISSHAQAYNGN